MKRLLSRSDVAIERTHRFSSFLRTGRPGYGVIATGRVRCSVPNILFMDITAYYFPI